MNPKTTLFYDVDTQRDFMLPEGKLYIPGAERLFPQLERLTTFARQQGIRIAAEHCMAGTEGQRKVTATLPDHPLWIINRPYTADELQALLRQEGEVYLEKQRFDVFSGNQNASQVLDMLLHGKEDLVVYGVVTEVCVDHAITGLKDRPVRLHVPVDAIAALNEEQRQEALARWRRWGVHLTTVAEVMSALET
jgi:nicotinamidase/pyrazinamidase